MVSERSRSPAWRWSVASSCSRSGSVRESEAGDLERAYPIWALIILGVDILIIWGLIENADEFG